MQGTELCWGFVQQSEDLCISSNHLYWAFVGKEVRQSHIEIVLGM
jgi:hypothetical protein